jgi:hypothetical protein
MMTLAEETQGSAATPPPALATAEQQSALSTRARAFSVDALLQKNAQGTDHLRFITYSEQWIISGIKSAI